MEPKDTSHLNAIRNRLSRERVRLSRSKTGREKEFHTVRVKQAEKELAAELIFLGIKEEPLPVMTNDELFAELDEMLSSIDK